MAGYFAADIVETPWGSTEDLRGRRLRPGPSASRDAVGRNQRERLFAAMVASTAGKGYPATTVADLITLAGVSRATFYEHFNDKAECFKATVEELFDEGLTVIQSNLEADGDPDERGMRALEALLRLAVTQPAAMRMSLLDAYSAGPAGLEPINHAFKEACELAHEALRLLPGRNSTPEQLSRAVIGGLHRILYVHLYRGEEEELLRNCKELWRWASGFAPPEGLPKPRKRRIDGPAEPPGRGGDRYERILRAFAVVVAARGFPNLTIPQVAAEAGVSNATFYQHFENKDDAMLAALDLSGAQLVAATLPAARRADDWPEAVHRALERVCGFLVAEPAFARLRTVEVYSAGPDALAHRDRAWAEIVEELVPAPVLAGDYPGALALEASSGAVYSLLYEKVRKDEWEEVAGMVPLFTYLMLSPYLGAEDATAVAVGRRARAVPGR